LSFLRGVYSEFVLGGHMLAFGTASIAAAAAIVLGEPAVPILLLMAYLFSYGAYMMNRSAEMDEDVVSHPDRTAHLAGRRRLLPAISGGAFLLGYILAATVNAFFFAGLLVPLLISLLYSVGSKRLKPIIGVMKLKDMLLVKNLVISFGWSLIPALVGLFFLAFSVPLLLLSAFIFLRLMVNTLIFDIRDAQGDREAGIRTVPTVFGPESTYRLMAGIDLATIVFVLASVASGLMPAFASVFALFPVYSLTYSFFARRPGANIGFICDVIVDGEYLLWGPLMYLGRALI
jgi:4-hydroxybenzoate polyprenyltransferase